MTSWQEPWHVRNGFGIGFGIIATIIFAVFVYGFWYSAEVLGPVDPDACAAARGAMLVAFADRYYQAGGPPISDAALFDLWQQQEWSRASDYDMGSYWVPPNPPECQRHPKR